LKIGYQLDSDRKWRRGKAPGLSETLNRVKNEAAGTGVADEFKSPPLPLESANKSSRRNENNHENEKKKKKEKKKREGEKGTNEESIISMLTFCQVADINRRMNGASNVYQWIKRLHSSATKLNSNPAAMTS